MNKIIMLMIFLLQIIYTYDMEQENQENNVRQEEIDKNSMIASYLFENNEFDESSRVYKEIFNLTNKLYFLKQSIIISSITLNKPNEIIRKINLYKSLKKEENKHSIEYLIINRILSDAYQKNGKFNKAAKILEKEPNIDYFMIGELYFKGKDYDNALKNLEIFINSKNEEEYEGLKALEYLISIYKDRNQINKALNKLKEYLKKNKNYVNFNIDYISEIYLKLDKIHILLDYVIHEFNEQKFTLEGVIIVMKKAKKYKEAIQFMKKYKSQFHRNHDKYEFYDFDVNLLRLYALDNDYANTYKLSGKIFDITNELEFLEIKTIYEYHMLENKKELSNIIKNIQTLIDKRNKIIIKNEEEEKRWLLQNAFFYNFLGYILIDHDVNPEKGIKYIDEALHINPNESAYIDSKAWGFYKLNDCKKAYEIMSKISDSDVEKNDEIKLHKSKIKECIK